MEVSTVEVKEYLNQMKSVILFRQAHWKRIDPRPHVTGILARANRVHWYDDILPKIDEAIKTIEEIEKRSEYIL